MKSLFISEQAENAEAEYSITVMQVVVGGVPQENTSV